MPDTVSSICSKADGFTKCGLRQIIFTDKSTGLTIQQWPYEAYDWNPVSSILTVKPASAKSKSILTATLSLMSHPKVIYQQEIIVTVAPPIKASPPFSVSNQSLSAVIYQEAILQLPDFGVKSSYALLGTQKYSVILQGTKLTVLSSNLADVGKSQIKMSLFIGNQTLNFQVNVIFTKNQTKKIESTQNQSSPNTITEANGNPLVISSKTPSTESASDDLEPAIRSLKKISNRGLLMIEFSKDVYPILNLTDFMIQTEIIVKYGSHYSYNTSSTIINMTDSQSLNIQINFSAPLNVSAGRVPDKFSFDSTRRFLHVLTRYQWFTQMIRQTSQRNCLTTNTRGRQQMQSVPLYKQ